MCAHLCVSMCVCIDFARGLGAMAHRVNHGFDYVHSSSGGVQMNLTSGSNRNSNKHSLAIAGGSAQDYGTPLRETAWRLRRCAGITGDCRRTGQEASKRRPRRAPLDADFVYVGEDLELLKQKKNSNLIGCPCQIRDLSSCQLNKPILHVLMKLSVFLTITTRSHPSIIAPE